MSPANSLFFCFLVVSDEESIKQINHLERNRIPGDLLPRSYENRSYLKDIETGKRLFTTVMYDRGERIEGTGRVIERLRKKLLEVAKEMGGKNLRTRDFIDFFRTRGPNYGDVVRQVIDEFVAHKKVSKRDIGTRKTNLYRYDLLLVH